MNMRYDPFLGWIVERIRKNKNCIVVINGATGSGKTYAGIRLGCDLAERMGTTFNVHNNMDFKFGELLKKMELPENQQAGTPFLFEEVGAVGGGASAREWQSKTNRFFHSFMQTSRHRQQVLILTCPSFSYLDKGARELCHSQIEMQSIDFSKRISVAKPYVLQVNRRTGKMYFKYLRFNDSNNSYKFKIIEFRMPLKKIVEDYEELKLIYTRALNKRIIEGDEVKKKENKTEYYHKCLNCKYEWVTTYENPKYCAKCRKYGVFSKENVVLGKVSENKPQSNLISETPQHEVEQNG